MKLCRDGYFLFGAPTVQDQATSAGFQKKVTIPILLQPAIRFRFAFATPTHVRFPFN